MLHTYVYMELIYVSMQDNYNDRQQSYVNMPDEYVLHATWIMLHVNITMLVHVDINTCKSNVNIIMLHVDIFYLAHRRQNYVTTEILIENKRKQKEAKYKYVSLLN